MPSTKIGPAAATAIGAGVAGLVGGAVIVRRKGWRLPFGIGYIAGRVRQFFGSAWKRTRAAVAGGGNDGDVSELTHRELYERAKKLDIAGRSGMSKDELAEAVSQAD